MLCALCFTLYALCSPVTAVAEEPLDGMRDEIISYFKPLTGRITKVQGQRVSIDLGTKDSVKTGMRLTIVREGAPFIHPITKETLGKMESSVGKLEIKEIGTDTSIGIIVSGEGREGDKVRISEKMVNMLFYLSDDVDWYLADSHYRSLRETKRFNMIDTGIETDDPSKVIEEAKRLDAEIALLLTAKTTESEVILTQRLFWVSDGSKFSEMDTKVDVAYAKELKFGSELLAAHAGEAWLRFDLPFKSKFVTTGDIEGDGKKEILLSAGTEIRAYIPGVDLIPALGGAMIKGSKLEEHLWVETADLNKNKRDEIIVTAMRGEEVVSRIYELKETEFVLLYTANVFLRRMGDGLIAQAYSKKEGFTGDVFRIVWDGGYRIGEKVKLPQGVNIYDFIYIDDPRTGKLLLSYDDKGFLNLYDENHIRIWRSKTDTGGAPTTFKKASPFVFIDKGEWSIRDRMYLRSREVFFVKRVPLLELARGLGYKSSQIISLWWNGLSMEEVVLIDNIGGALVDYAVAEDKIIVLSTPLFGIKAKNILKGESPLGSMLYIYSTKGR
jgi:hypothetical protein